MSNTTRKQPDKRLSNALEVLHEIESKYLSEYENACPDTKGTFEANTEKRTLTLQGYVGNDMISKVENALEDMGEGPIEVRLNSGGGDVFSGFSIYNTLREHDGQITTVSNAMAASAASLIFLSGDERQVATGGRVMVHRARVGLLAFMTGPKLRRTAEKLGAVLESIDNEIVDLISERSELSRTDALKAVDEETYFTADQSIKNGIATKKYEVSNEADEVEITNEEIKEMFNAARFRQQVWSYNAR